ncbi:ATP-binding protein [Acaryochloris sp. IP29b_bin.148]|uniref:ATP-binding protein n=1 Tax=Acaryochloris sp. IP29b_bin.148 TaxID=2969218 RepID=UPI00261EEFDD|nr:ATP-binding protein [Acaryochloris sp. IP29b_bin.148]
MSVSQTHKIRNDQAMAANAFQAFFELSPHLCCIICPDFSFVQLNQAWTQSLGWSLSELMAGSFLNSVDPQTQPATIAAYQTVQAGQTVQFQNCHLHKDGGSRGVTWQLWQDEQQLTYGIGTLLDQDGSPETALEQEPLAAETILDPPLPQADSFLSQQLLALQALQADLESQKLETTVSSQILYDISLQGHLAHDDEALLQSILEDLCSTIPYDISGGVFLTRMDDVLRGHFAKRHHQHRPQCKFFIKTYRPLPHIIEYSIQNTILKNLAYLSGVDLQAAQLNVDILDPQAIDDQAPPLGAIQSQLFVPLIVPTEQEPQVIGLLFVGAEQAAQFNEEHVRLLYFAASHVAMLIQRLRSRLAIDQLAQVIKNLTDGVLLLDQRRRVVLANGKAQNYLALLSEMGTDKCLRQLGNKTLEELMNCTLDDPDCREVTLLEHPDRVFEATIKPISMDPHLDYWVVVIRDISDRKRFEAKIQNALENARELVNLKSRVIRTVSHEYRSPLSVIRMAAELLENRHQQLDVDQRNHFLGRIQQATRYMAELVDDMLLIEQTESGRMDFTPIKLDLQAFCQRLVNEHQLLSNHNHTLLFACEGNDTTLTADPKLLRQILTNLLTNAIKYSPDGGAINVQLICSPETAMLSVADQGIGIPPKDQSDVFEAFFRAENVDVIKGSGLGLSIAKKFVELHGGQIQIASQVNQGTTVTIQFPATTQGPKDSASL